MHGSHNKVSIIGLGNILEGDLGVACHILETISLEPFEDSVQIMYAGDNPRYAGGLIYDADLLIVVGALFLGGPPGRLNKWNFNVFRQHLAWLAAEYLPIRLLIEAIARTELAGKLPQESLFIWIEPQLTLGYGLSIPAQKAVRKATMLIKQELFKRSLFLKKPADHHGVRSDKTRRGVDLIKAIGG